MRELAVQAANDTYSDGDRANLQLEIDQLSTEIDRIAQSTSWGGVSLLNGGAGNDRLAASMNETADFTFQIGTGTTDGQRVSTFKALLRQL